MQVPRGHVRPAPLRPEPSLNDDTLTHSGRRGGIAALELTAATRQAALADWLRHVRPWYGHHYHFHVRLKCPEGQSGCRNQAPPPPGSGCGAELAWWFTDAPYKPKPGKPSKPAETMLPDLPAACRTVLLAE